MLRIGRRRGVADPQKRLEHQQRPERRAVVAPAGQVFHDQMFDVVPVEKPGLASGFISWHHFFTAQPELALGFALAISRDAGVQASSRAEIAAEAAQGAAANLLGRSIGEVAEDRGSGRPDALLDVDFFQM